MESLEPAIFEARDDDSPVTEKERSQLRGLLGTLQWRCYNTAPQHAARLSLIQSEVNTATIATAKSMNKLLTGTRFTARRMWNSRVGAMRRLAIARTMAARAAMWLPLPLRAWTRARTRH